MTNNFWFLKYVVNETLFCSVVGCCGACYVVYFGACCGGGLIVKPMIEHVVEHVVLVVNHVVPIYGE